MLGHQILDAITQGTGETVEMRRIEFVGPNVGDELAENGGNILATSNRKLHNKILKLLKPFSKK